MTHFSPTRRSFDLSGSAASGLAATPAGQPGAKVGGRQRLGDEISLGDIAAQPGGTIPGGAGLDALGHRGHAELAGEANARRDDVARHRIMGGPADEAAVDLQFLEGTDRKRTRLNSRPY